MSATVILIEVELVSPAGGGLTLRFCDRAMRPFPPTDGDRANLVWDDRLAEPPVWKRSLFQDITKLAPGRSGGGMVLKNADGGLDAYQGHAWNAVRVMRWTEGTPFAAAETLLRGQCALPAYDHRSSAPATVRVDLYDEVVELDQSIQSTLFAGTNNGTTILYEGSPDGLKGRAKPIAYGDLTEAQLPPILVNPGNFVFQLGDGPLSGSELIFDGGADAGYADEGDKSDAVFVATTPSAACYITNLNRGLVKINGAPVLNLTFGIKGQSSPSYVETAGPIAARLLARAGVPGGRIGGSIAAIASTAPIGVFAADQVSASELLGWVARSALTAILPDRTGVYQAIAFGPPKVTADLMLEVDHILNLEEDTSAGGPIGEVRVGWGRIWTTFSSGELKASVRGTPLAERLANEYRWALAENATAKARFPRAWRKLEIPTALRAEADALALAASLMDLFGLRADGTPRRMWRVTVNPVLDHLAAELGDTVALSYPPRDIADNFVLVAEEPMRPRRDQAVWTLWG